VVRLNCCNDEKALKKYILSFIHSDVLYEMESSEFQMRSGVIRDLQGFLMSSIKIVFNIDLLDSTTEALFTCVVRLNCCNDEKAL
jgi:hypothetical protein